MRSLIRFLYFWSLLPFRVAYAAWKTERECNRMYKVMKVALAKGYDVEAGDLIALNKNGHAYPVNVLSDLTPVKCPPEIGRRVTTHE